MPEGKISLSDTDNTSDVRKPVPTLQHGAIAAYADSNANTNAKIAKLINSALPIFSFLYKG